MGIRRILASPHSITAIIAVTCATGAQATDVALVGLLPGKVLVVVDGSKPRSIPVGVKTPDGIKVLSIEEGAAQFEIDGRKRRLVVGEHVVSAGSDERGEASVSLTADASGHFVTLGAINGATVRFIVDTGATLISMGAGDAVRANIDYQKGRPAMSMTANGPTRIWLVTLNSVRVGDVSASQVEAAVHESDLPVVLLGMSFLNRMEMKRDGQTMTLKKRY